ncbi:MAG: hypothetical protein GY753_07665 [Gammaproteobacteria bacterium]|nr:hypothetical protein [Gammaproteobacteria bacterium]
MTEATHNVDALDPVARIEGILSASEEPQEEIQAETVEAEAEAEAPEPAIEAATEGEEEDQEVQAQDEAEETDEVKTETDAVEELELDASDLSGILGLGDDSISVAEDGQIKVKTKVDGETSEVTLPELLKGYQVEAHSTRKSMELADAKKAFDAEKEQQQTEIHQRLQAANALVDHAEQSLLAEYNNVDWDTLRQTDPGEFAAQRQAYGERYQQVQAAKEAATSGLDQQSAEQKEAQQQQFAKYLHEQDEALNSAMRWTSPEEATKAKTEVVTYLQGQGFSEQEIGGIADHRAVLMAHKAMMFDQQVKTADVAKKRVKKLPKVLKPGASKSKEQKQNETRKVQMRNIRKNGGKVDDIAALLLDRL